jgi:hypothetical protein
MAHGEFSMVAGEGGGVMAGVPGSALGLAPSAISFGECGGFILGGQSHMLYIL